MKHRTLLITDIRLILLVLLVLACVFSPGPRGTDRATDPSESVERVFLDLCSLVREEEAEMILGGPVDVSHQMDGSCEYSAGNDPTSIGFLTVSAAQGEEAGVYAIEKLGLLKAADTTPSFKEIVDRSPEMTLGEVMTEVLKYLQDAGGEVTPYSALGDAAYWLVPPEQVSIPSELGKLGRLVTVNDDAYVQVTLAGGGSNDLGPALGQLVSLMPTFLGRLPQAFYVIPDEGEAFMPDKTHEPATVSGAPTNTFVGLVGVTSPSTGQVFVIDPLTNRVITADVGGTPVDIAHDGGLAWLAGGTEGVVRMFDPVNRRIINTVSVGGTVLRLAVGTNSSVWASGDFGVKHIPFLIGDQQDVVDSSCHDVAMGDDAVWVTQPQNRQVLKVEPATGMVIETIVTEGQPTELVYGLGFLWVLLGDTGQLVQIEPQDGRIVSSISLSKTATALTIGLDRVWYTSDTGIVYVKPDDRAGLINVPHPLAGIAVYAGSIWVTSPDEGIVLRIAPEMSGSAAPGEIVEIMTGGAPTAISSGP